MLGKLIDELTSRGIVRKKWSRRDVFRVFDSLELELVAQGIPPSLVDSLKEEVARELDGTETKGDPKEIVRNAIKSAIRRLLPPQISLDDVVDVKDLYKVVFFGFNGVGKSLSIVKMAKYLQGKGKRVLVVSADTYRAAAGDQL